MTILIAVLAVMGILALVECVIPLRARDRTCRPNLALTAIAFATSFGLNSALVVVLDRLDGGLPVILGVVVLDASWYLLHRAMHAVPALWRVHRVHHSDPLVDVTTTVRQHPIESVLRYATLAVFATGFGVGVAAFTIYRVWSAMSGLAEHANLRMPRWLDRGLALLVVSPDMHKVHHSRDARDTDTNFGNIFSVFDRLFGSFARSRRDITYGLDGLDGDQTTLGLLALPFRDRVRSTSRAA